MKREGATIGDLAQILGGGTPSTRVPEYWSGDIPWFTPAEIPKSGAGVVTTSERTITQAGLEHSAAKILPAGSVLMTSRASIGHCAIAGVPVATNQGFTSLVPKDCRSTRYLYYWAQYNRDKLLARASGSTFLEISASEVRDISIDPPALEEQRAIGDVLTSIDRLIRCLEQLIVKKQSVKQGMMEQLLTGRTRLPGFTESWTDSHAGELGKFRGGSGFPHRFQGSAEGDIPFYKVSDMNINGNEVFMRSANNYIKASERQQIGAVLMPAGSIIFAKVGAALFLERKRMLTVPSCIDNNMVSFIADENRVDRYFMYYVLSRFSISSLSATGALPSVNNRQLGSIPISMPRELAEQRAIAVVLRDIDSEIGALRKRLGKARDVKAGMMQQLLTGRVRLPVEVAV